MKYKIEFEGIYEVVEADSFTMQTDEHGVHGYFYSRVRVPEDTLDHLSRYPAVYEDVLVAFARNPRLITPLTSP